MAITVAAFETALDAAVTALSTNGFDTARNALAQGMVIAAGLPRTTIDGVTIDYSHYTTQIKALMDLVDAVEAHVNRSTGRLISTRTAHSRRGKGRGVWGEVRGDEW